MVWPQRKIFPSHPSKGEQPPHLVKKMKFGIFNFFLLGAVNKHPNCVKMKFEGDLTSIMVTRDFFGTATTTRFALTRQGNGCGVVAIMMWVTEAEAWCWWDLWTPWPPSPGNFQEAKAYLHVLGQQRSLNPCSPPFIPAPRHLSTLKNSPRNPVAPSISSNPALSFCHLNSRSLINKIPEIKHFLHTNGIQLLAISETWLHPNIPDNLVQLEEFQPVFRRDRRTGQHGGGVCMFLSNDLPAKRRDDLEHPELEVLWVEICPSPIKFNGRIHQSLLVGCCYRPPSSTNIFYQYLESVLDKAAETDIVLLGDFNAKHKNWYSEDVTNSHGSALKDLMDSFNMSQLVNKPTHLNSEGVPVSLLDLAFTNVPDLFSPMVDVMHPIGLSDHLPVVLHTAAHHRTAVPLAQRASMRTPTTKWCFEPQDCDRMNDAFLFDNWTHVFERAENINETWERWKKQFFDDLQLFLPYRVTPTNHGKNRSSPAWFDKNIRHLIRVKNRLFKRACSTGLLDHRAIYCKARNEANSAIRKAKTAFYVKQANLMADRNCPATKWWHLAKSLCGLGNSGSPMVAPLLNESQSTVFDDWAKADLLNDTFVNQNNSLNPRGFPYGPTHLKSVFRLKHIPASDVKKAIQRLPNKMSTGSDLISYRLLKAAAPGIVGPLTTLFNLSLKRHEVPNEWKHSVVCPIFKGGRKDRRVPTNYRPISLTSCVARLMEKIINVQVWITFSLTPFFISISLAFCQHTQRLHNWFIFQISGKWH